MKSILMKVDFNTDRVAMIIAFITVSLVLAAHCAEQAALEP